MIAQLSSEEYGTSDELLSHMWSDTGVVQRAAAADDVIVDEELECKVEAVLQLINISDANAQQRCDELQLALTAVEKMERDLCENIALLKGIRDRVLSFCIHSADLSRMKDIRDQLLVS